MLAKAFELATYLIGVDTYADTVTLECCKPMTTLERFSCTLRDVIHPSYDWVNTDSILGIYVGSIMNHRLFGMYTKTTDEYRCMKYEVE